MINLMNKIQFSNQSEKSLLFKQGIFSMILAGLLFGFVGTAYSKGDEKISLGEFVETLSKSQPKNAVLPKGYSSLNDKALYNLANEALKKRGFKVLEGKSPSEPLTDKEFIRLTYAMTGAPSGKSLYEQKKYLKESGMVITDDIGLTTGIEGTVSQSHKGQKGSKNTELATPVYMHDRIKTEKDSSAAFTFDDESQLVLGEEANIRVSKHIYDPDKDFRQTIVKLALGTVRFKVTKGKSAGSEFKVVTPTAIAGVRGTEFVVTVAEDGTTSFTVLEGEIETAPFTPESPLESDASFLSSDGQRVSSFIGAGKTQNIGIGGITSPVMEASQELLNNVQEITKAPVKVIGKTARQVTKLAATTVSKSVWLAKTVTKNLDLAVTDKPVNQVKKVTKKP